MVLEDEDDEENEEAPRNRVLFFVLCPVRWAWACSKRCGCGCAPLLGRNSCSCAGCSLEPPRKSRDDVIVFQQVSISMQWCIVGWVCVCVCTVLWCYTIVRNEEGMNESNKWWTAMNEFDESDECSMFIRQRSQKKRKRKKKARKDPPTRIPMIFKLMCDFLYLKLRQHHATRHVNVQCTSTSP